MGLDDADVENPAPFLTGNDGQRLREIPGRADVDQWEPIPGGPHNVKEEPMAHHGKVIRIGEAVVSQLRATDRSSEELHITWSRRRCGHPSRAAASAASFQSVIFAATFLLVLLCLSPLTLPAQRPF